MNRNNKLPDAMTDTPTCPACGTPIAQGRGGEMCPACLLHAAMADCYRNGQGVTMDEEEALKWWRKAARQHDPAAQNCLGVCSERGEGMAKHELEAYKWSLLAAAQGDAKAKDNASLLELVLTLDQIAEGKRRADHFKPQERTQP